jgi:hypothetical protein
LNQRRKKKPEAAGSSGAVQALGMENGDPVVGPDAPTADPKMVELPLRPLIPPLPSVAAAMSAV